MESRKQGSSETSSNENDRQEEVKEETEGGSVTAPASAVKRSYECTFCKRGFTNAQALGGHMNIHRKDRAKTKQTATASSVSSKLAANEDYTTNPNFGGPIPIERGKYYPVLESQKSYHMMNYQQSWGSSPRQPLGVSYYPGSHEFLVPRPQSSTLSINHEEVWGANLSLRINSSSTHVEVSNDSSEVKAFSKGDEVDLELRLGHSPSYRQPH